MIDVRKTRLCTEGELLLQRLNCELKKPDNELEIQRESLIVVTRKLTKYIQIIEGDRALEGNAGYTEITRIIMDEWPLGSELGIALSQWEKDFVEL